MQSDQMYESTHDRFVDCDVVHHGQWAKEIFFTVLP